MIRRASVIRRLKDPRTWLALFGTLFVLVVADTFRRPDAQVTGATYCLVVRGYQLTVSPRLRGHVQCRFEPTCSQYSRAAVQKYGIRRGLVMTLGRIRRCERSTPLGTVDWP